MRKLLLFMVVPALAAPALSMTLWDNGPWITGYGNGVGGADTSLIESIVSTCPHEGCCVEGRESCPE